jgi:hypothetical protein
VSIVGGGGGGVLMGVAPGNISPSLGDTPLALQARRERGTREVNRNRERRFIPYLEYVGMRRGAIEHDSANWDRKMGTCRAGSPEWTSRCESEPLRVQ